MQDGSDKIRRRKKNVFVHGKHVSNQEYVDKDFPGGAVVKNPPANAGDTISIPGPGSSHMPRSN